MSERIKCPKCGAENYKSDTVCMSCGASLRAPTKPPEQKAEERVSPREPGKPEPKEKAKPRLPFMVRALLISVVAAFIEFALVALLSKGKDPTHVYYIPVGKLSVVLTVLLGGLIYGAIRGGVIGGLLHFTKWSPGIAMLFGGAIGWAFVLGGGWVTILVGLIVGYILGVMREQED